MKLIRRTFIRQTNPVYDIKVKDNHNFYITKNDILVHNSGKGFIASKLIGIEGKVLDVDAVKKLAVGSIKLAKRIKDETGYDIKNFDLKNPDNVTLLHKILQDYDIIDKKNHALFTSIMTKTHDKPNLIFDVTLKSITKLHNIVSDVEYMGYDKKDIHIVWVINDFKVALKQNRERDRMVPEDILIDTHSGASTTMRKIIDMGPSIKQYMDGDIWFVFNKIFVDIKIAKSENGGEYVTDVNYIKVKEAGKNVMSYDKISDNIKQKIYDYTPKRVKSWK